VDPSDLEVSFAPGGEPGQDQEFLATIIGSRCSYGGWFRVGPAGAEIVRLEITLDFSEGGSIDSTDLRAIPIAALKQRLRGLAESVGQMTPTYNPARYAPRPRPGRPGYPDEHYRFIAIRYITLAREGRSRGIRGLLAAEMSGRLGVHIAENTIGEWLHRARELGFLAPGQRGKVVSEPGPRLYGDGGME
jgi:hypothetical protein